MNDKENLPPWAKHESVSPSEAKKGRITGSTVASTSAWKNAWCSSSDSPPTPSINPKTAQFTSEICFIDANGAEDSGYYISIQGMRIRNSENLRVFLPHVVVDIVTSNARELRKIIYSKRFNEIEAGKNYDDINVIAVQFYDPDNLPPIPTS